MREWLSGGVSPCQGEGRGFESRLALFQERVLQIMKFMMKQHPCSTINVRGSYKKEYICFRYIQVYTCPRQMFRSRRIIPLAADRCR